METEKEREKKRVTKSKPPRLLKKHFIRQSENFAATIPEERRLRAWYWLSGETERLKLKEREQAKESVSKRERERE